MIRNVIRSNYVPKTSGRINAVRQIFWGSNCPEERYMVGEEDEPWLHKQFHKFTQPLDMSIRGSRHYVKRQLRIMEYERQRFNVLQRNTLTPDLAAMSFVMLMGGQAKCEGQTFWIHSMKDQEAILPLSDRIRARLEAINLSYTDIMYHGLENLEGTELKWLSVRNCPNIDDWSLNRIAVEFRDSLEYLDVSGCPKVTHRGLAALHKTRKLETLVMKELPNLEHPELITIMMSQLLPTCNVSGYISTLPPDEVLERERQALSRGGTDQLLESQGAEQSQGAGAVVSLGAGEESQGARDNDVAAVRQSATAVGR